MKTLQKVLVIGAILFAANTAWAQATSTGLAGAAGVDITLAGTIESSLVLVVDGVVGNTVLTGGPATMPTRAAGTVNFGTFNTQSTALATGTISRVTAATPGAFAVARLAFTPTYSGNAGGPAACNVNVTLGAAGGTSQIAAGNTRVNNTYVGTTATGGWATSAAGAAVGAAAVSVCPNVDTANGNCASGTTYTHELAVFVPDTQAGGTFTQVVLYDATTY